jgi:hypothetical protein
MNARSIELFKALTEATFWFYTHPKETSYRITYNKSRYTMDKVRVLKMLRLYLPFVRRLDDDALVTYMYRNGGVVMAQVQSGQLANLQSISDDIPNTLQAITDQDLTLQQKAIDEAIRKEQETQKERNKEDRSANVSPPVVNSTNDKTKIPTDGDKTRLEDLAKRAEKSGLGVTNSSGAIITPINEPITLVPPIVANTGGLVIANKSGVIQDKAGIKTDLVIPRRPTQSQPPSGPTVLERTIGGTMGILSGTPIVEAGKKISSQGQISVKRVSDYVTGSIQRRFNGEKSNYNNQAYAVDEEYDEFETYQEAGGDDEPKKGGSFLGLGLGWWIAIIIILILIFTALSGGDEEKKDNPTGPGGSSGGADYSVCKFTRAGSSKTIGSSILAGWIRDAATKEGVPPAMLASVAMHENPDFTANAKNDHDGIVNDQLCNKSPTFCVLRGSVLHSKAYTTGENDPCTPSEIANGAQTAQAVGLMQFLDIYNSNKDLCKISVSLELAAAKLKNSKITDNPTAEEVNEAIKAYHGSCFYGSYNYCSEVYTDYKNCVPKPAENSCSGGWPTTGTITQGPVGGSHDVYRGRGMVAIDIAAPTGTPVYATFNGTIIGLSTVDTGDADGRGLYVSIQADIPGKSGPPAIIRYLHFSQLAEGIKNGQKVEAGSLLGYVGESGRAAGAHLHMDFENLDFVPPYVPIAIRPLECVNSSCQPRQVTACK